MSAADAQAGVIDPSRVPVASVAAAAPIAALTSTSETLRIIRQPFSTAGLGPPRSGIDSRPILTELNIENRLFRANSDCGGGASCRIAHRAYGLSGENELANLDANPRHASQNNIISRHRH